MIYLHYSGPWILWVIGRSVITCINPEKIKEIVACFCKDEDHHSNILKLAINWTITQRLSHAKLLGVTLSANLCSNIHVENIVHKASKWFTLLVLYQVKRAGSEQKDLLKDFFICNPTSVEHACPVCYPHLPKYLSASVECIPNLTMSLSGGGCTKNL